jgi:branched-chain amino acid transport system ATP-binding protein
LKALKSISFEVDEGEMHTLIGANGAGKTTCLKAISGLIPITSGEIRFDGISISGMSPQGIVRRGISHIPEGKKLFPDLSVYDNLIAGAFLRKDTEKIKSDIDLTYEYFPVLKLMRKRKAATLSGGEQQMLAIGRALMNSPKLLLMDEPSLGLSPLLTQEVFQIIRQIKLEGMSILLVEQNARLALNLADRACVLEVGEIVASGDAKGMLTRDEIRKAYLGM